MTRSRLLILLVSALGFGLLSGSVAQVAALDGDLQQAAAKVPVPVRSVVDDGSEDDVRVFGADGCRRAHRPAAARTD